MTRERNPLAALKDIPYFDPDFFKELTGMDWPDPTGLFDRLGRGKWPPVDVVETAGEVIIMAAIPGLRQASDVRLELQGNTLHLTGEIGDSEFQLLPTVRVHCQERRRGKFSRAITLPAAVNSKSARASYQRGVLEVRLAKLPGGQGETLNIEFLK
ncbi:MAG: hypothetical protein PWQ18_1072 [Clostridia bacterium]|nr:hypothetical protein [Clostridia bacterium]